MDSRFDPVRIASLRFVYQQWSSHADIPAVAVRRIVEAAGHDYDPTAEHVVLGADAELTAEQLAAELAGEEFTVILLGRCALGEVPRWVDPDPDRVIAALIDPDGQVITQISAAHSAWATSKYVRSLSERIAELDARRAAMVQLSGPAYFNTVSGRRIAKAAGVSHDTTNALRRTPLTAHAVAILARDTLLRAGMLAESSGDSGSVRKAEVMLGELQWPDYVHRDVLLHLRDEDQAELLPAVEAALA
ncbi:hypothetical protein ACWEQA_23675 [Nocardia sp. NPDC004085]